MLQGFTALGRLLGLLFQKFLMALPSSSFSASDVTSGLDTFNSSHFLNYLNWFIPVGLILNIIGLWLTSIMVGVCGILLLKFLIKKVTK